MARYPSQRRGKRLLKRLGLLFAILFGVWLAGLIQYAGSIPMTVEEPERRTDAIVVLTGGSGRLDEGLNLLADDMGERLFVSGVYQGVDVKTLFKMFQHNPEELETRVGIGTATNTTGNATETAEWIREQGFSSLRLVTASYHMPRSLLEFHHSMPTTDIVSHPVFPEHVKVNEWWAWRGTAGLIAGEYNKFMLAWIRQQTEAFSLPKAID